MALPVLADRLMIGLMRDRIVNVAISRRWWS